MAPNVDSPEIQALAELERTIRHVTEELATWRRRALRAEGHRADLSSGHDIVSARERILELERENIDMAGRLASARERLAQILGRLKFLEEQVAMEERAR